MFSQIVLAYHLVDRRGNFGITWITPSQFERQMNWLAETEYRSCSLSELITDAEAHAPKKVVITFDDGFHALAQYALPILTRFRFRATVFPVAGYVGRQNRWDVNFFGRRFQHLDWVELRELLAAGWEIGSHSLRHAYLPSLSHAELKNDLESSRKILEDHLQIPIRHLSLPFGRGNAQVFRSAWEAGYQTVATLGQKLHAREWEGCRRADASAEPLRIISRRGIYLHDTLRSFQRRVQAGDDSKREYMRQRAISWFSTGTIIVKAATRALKQTVR